MRRNQDYINVFNPKNLYQSLSTFEKCLWVGSCVSLLLLFIMNPHRDGLTLIASLLGATMLIFLAKGNVIAQFITILFSILYAIISYRYHYYGEMITYLFMTTPSAVLTAIAWLKHPYREKKEEVLVAKLSIEKWIGIILMTIVSTIIFYFVLRYFHTANLIWSTVSIATSCFAAFHMFMRSPFYAMGYAVNDIVLIVLWTLASMEDKSYITMVLCFIIFLVNDIYGYVSWKNMQKRQSTTG